ncbi:MAG: uroporphyrinogen methyltransferase / synthase [Solirubrobacteraceae bacterium]|nr:uroporphyrinogen methyltransferase / synthase [Solirubrobacteraceae bacterium]
MTVYLVGAGPGDPGLLTVRAQELIARAEVLLYDLLIGPEILAGAPADAELIFVGKRGGGEQVPQEETNRLLVEHARAGRTVVRLKGGDPFVFGRGSEEAQVLRAAGLAYEVVPGITAGIAAPAYAGVPVTHRDIAAGVAFITGSRAELDWEALARFPGTLVFYMGVRALPRITEGLIGGGRAPDEPVAIVERGTMAGQRTVHATLATAAGARVSAPAVIVVGPVAALGEELSWRELRPLHEVRVAVTRARAQASPLAATLRDLGAEVVEAPAIRTRSLEAELPPLAGHDLIVVSSPNGAHELFAALERGGDDARSLAGHRIAAMGPGTARALREHGISADIVPDRAVAEGMVEALADVPIANVLVVRAREGRDVLPDALRERGAAVTVVALYETIAEPLDGEPLAAVDWITFTSASTVRFLAEAAGGLPAGPRLASIGPATSAALREHGREPDVEADPHTPDGLVAALLAARPAQP